MADYRDLYDQYVTDITDPGPTGEWYSCRCPIHVDEHASAGISKKTGVFKCFVCGEMSPASFLTRVLDITRDEAHKLVDAFRTENDIVEKHNTFTSITPISTPKLERLYRQSQAMMAEDRPGVKEYIESRGIRYETLLTIGVGWLPADETPDYWRRDSLVFPYIHSGKVVGVRYRDRGTNKSGEKGCHFGLWGIDQIDDDPETIIICEGETDRIVAFQAVLGSDHVGKWAVLSTPTADFKEHWARDLIGARNVILIPQYDAPSLRMVDKARAVIENLIVVHPHWKRKQTGKDLADWFRYNTNEDFIALIEGVIADNDKRILTGAEFAEAAAKPRQWLIEGVLSRRQVGLIGGLPKSKKTWAMLNIVRSLISQEPLFDIPHFKVSPQSVPLNILVWEEEGAIEELYERVDLVMADIDWKAHTFWAHHLGLRLDSDIWLQRLQREIETHQIDVLLLDPFSRTYAVDEDKASEMGQVWSRIAALMTKYKHLTIIIIHHFNKSGSVNDGWTALRGSGRSAAEVDLGIFMEAVPTSQGGGARLKIEGRSIRTPVASDGSEVFHLRFEKGRLQVEERQAVLMPESDLLTALEQSGGEMYLTDAAKLVKVSIRTIRKWAEKAKDPSSDTPLVTIATVLGPGSEEVIKLNK